MHDRITCPPSGGVNGMVEELVLVENEIKMERKGNFEKKFSQTVGTSPDGSQRLG